jgi:hypothetical protein
MQCSVKHRIRLLAVVLKHNIRLFVKCLGNHRICLIGEALS